MKIMCGSNIKHFRQKNGLSQAELGIKIGVSRQAISSWETNRTEPTIGDIEKMVKILGCSLEDITRQGRDTESLILIEAYKNADEQTKRIVRYALGLSE